MIFDKIENIELYKNLSENLGIAIAYVQSNNINSLPIGKHEIAGDDVFVIINDYETKNEVDCKPEAHKKYIDIQIMLSGNEYMGYAPLKEQKVSQAYDNDKDLVFYKSGTNKLKFLAGEFAIFFPADIHQPGIMFNEISNVKKAVFKVKV